MTGTCYCLPPLPTKEARAPVPLTTHYSPQISLHLEAMPSDLGPGTDTDEKLNDGIERAWVQVSELSFTSRANLERNLSVAILQMR